MTSPKAEPRSYIAILEAADDHILITGNKTYTSLRFEKEHHAQALVNAMHRHNVKAGNEMKLAIVAPSEGAPQVLAENVETTH